MQPVNYGRYAPAHTNATHAHTPIIAFRERDTDDSAISTRFQSLSLFNLWSGQGYSLVCDPAWRAVRAILLPRWGRTTDQGPFRGASAYVVGPSRCPHWWLLRSQLPDRGRHNGGPGRDSGLCHPSAGTVVEPGLPSVHSHASLSSGSIFIVVSP